MFNGPHSIPLKNTVSTVGVYDMVLELQKEVAEIKEQLPLYDSSMSDDTVFATIPDPPKMHLYRWFFKEENKPEAAKAIEEYEALMERYIKVYIELKQLKEKLGI